MEKSKHNVMYLDYKFWYNRQTGVITLDEEMNLEIPNGKKFKFVNNQFTPMEDDWDEKRMDIIGQNGNDGLHYTIDSISNPKWTYNTYTDAYEIDKTIRNTESSLMGIIYENKE